MAADVGGDVVVPSSFSTSFMAAKIGRSGQPVQKPGGRGGTMSASALTRRVVLHRRTIGARAASVAKPTGSLAAKNARRPASMTSGGVFAGHRQHVLAGKRGVDVGAPQDRVDRLLDEIRLAFLDHQHRALADAERDQFVVDQRIGDVQDMERHARRAPNVGEAEQLQRAHDAVVHAALQDDADLGDVAGERLVEPARLDELHRRRPASLDLVLLMHDRRRAAARCGRCRAADFPAPGAA